MTGAAITDSLEAETCVSLWSLLYGSNLQALQTAKRQNGTLSCIIGSRVTVRNQKPTLTFGEKQRRLFIFFKTALRFWGSQEQNG